ncbi:MAG: outer membrane protein assembly factor BamB family protein [Thermoguttaceae bacterium]
MARSPAALIPDPVAAQHGLTRAWAAQVQVDPARGRLQRIVLEGGTLFAQSDQGTLEAFDAQSGKRLWAAQIGRRGYPTFPPAVNSSLVGVVSGSSVYVLNRFSGRILWSRQLDGAPSAGPALSERRIYTPLANGVIASYALQPEVDWLAELGGQPGAEALRGGQRTALEAAQHESFRLSQDNTPPLLCRGPGRPTVAPLVTRQNPEEEFIAWTTDQGYLCVGRVDRTRTGAFALLYRLQTDAPLANQPCYLPPNPDLVGDSGVIFAASQDGFVYAVRERDGQQLWRFSTGGPVVESPVVLGRFVIVTNQLGGMYCLDAKNMGNQVWWAPEVTRFVAASKQRVYAEDAVGRLRVLNGKNGALLDVLPTEQLPIKLANTQTDRLVLASSTGLVQCLHEIGLSEPLMRSAPRTEEPAGLLPEATKVVRAEKPATEPAAAETPAKSRPSGLSRATTPKTSGTPTTSSRTSGSTRSGSSRSRGSRATGQFVPSMPMGPEMMPPDQQGGRRGNRRNPRNMGPGMPPNFPGMMPQAPGGRAPRRGGNRRAEES